MKERIINILVTILVLAGLVYIFRNEIFSFLNQTNTSSLLEFLKKGMTILVSVLSKVFDLIKNAFGMIADLILKIVSNVKDLYGFFGGIISFLTKLFNLIYGVLTSFAGKL